MSDKILTNEQIRSKHDFFLETTLATSHIAANARIATLEADLKRDRGLLMAKADKANEAYDRVVDALYEATSWPDDHAPDPVNIVQDMAARIAELDDDLMGAQKAVQELDDLLPQRDAEITRLRNRIEALQDKCAVQQAMLEGEGWDEVRKLERKVEALEGALREMRSQIKDQLAGVTGDLSKWQFPARRFPALLEIADAALTEAEPDAEADEPGVGD